MITRKNRKQSLKVREMKEVEEQLESDGERDRKRLVRIFLETWLDAKQNLIQNGGSLDDPNETIHDAISRKLVAKGFNISSKLALNKTAGFYKKYQFVRKCEQEGKKIEWANYDIVKKIFELSEPIPEATVMIPVNNIKSEDELTIIEEEEAGIVDKKCISDANVIKVPTAQLQRKQTKVITPTIPPTTTTNNPTIKTEVNTEVELVEIGKNDCNITTTATNDDDPTKNSIERSSTNDDESEVSDLDDELDFENPLDNITLRLPGSDRPSSTTSSLSMPPPAKRSKRNSTEAKPIQIPLPPLKTQNDIKLHKIPNHPSKLSQKSEGGITTPPPNVPLIMPGLKPGEFLIPTGSTKPGQKQQFLVVKRLPKDGNTVTNPTSVLNGKLNQSTGTAATTASGIRNLTPQIKVASTPPPRPSPSHSPFMSSNTPPPPPPPLNVPGKNIQIPITSIRQQQQPSQSQETTILLAKLFDMHSAIKSIEKERFELEQKRYEAEIAHQKELISIFKDIRDNLCDRPKTNNSTT